MATTPNELQALMTMGKLGLDALASRVLSIVTLLGILAVAGYVVWAPSWYGVAGLGILAVLVFSPALRAESLRRHELQKGVGNE